MYFVHPSQFSDVCVCVPVCMRVCACMFLHGSGWACTSTLHATHSFIHLLLILISTFFPRIFYSPGIMVAAEFLFVL